MVICADQCASEGAKTTVGRGRGREQSREDPEAQGAERPGGLARVQWCFAAWKQQPQEETQVRPHTNIFVNDMPKFK